MEIINSQNSVAIVKRALNLIDARLIDHGERVAFIVNKMMMKDNDFTPQEITFATILAIFHDIGAYKTEEIDKMVAFETSEFMEHSIYGYLFLKNFSPLYELADCVLYHHKSFDKLAESNCLHKHLTAILHLADTVDLKISNGFNPDENLFEQNNNLLCNNAKKLFFEADKEFNIIEAIKSKEYSSQMEDFFKTIKLSQNDIDRFLQMLVFSIDFRSEYTVSHTLNTMRISQEISKLMVLSDIEQRQIYYGAMLHDIGKVATPLSILEKPGSLTPEEMAIMQKHINFTEEILNGVVDEKVKLIAIRHHEKLDGSGYPYKITDKDLSLPEKIVAVADIISALSDERSYKKAFDKQAILDILIELKDNNKLCEQVICVVILNYNFIIQNKIKSSEETLAKYKAMKSEFLTIQKDFKKNAV